MAKLHRTPQSRSHPTRETTVSTEGSAKSEIAYSVGELDNVVETLVAKLVEEIHREDRFPDEASSLQLEIIDLLKKFGEISHPKFWSYEQYQRVLKYNELTTKIYNYRYSGEERKRRDKYISSIVEELKDIKRTDFDLPQGTDGQSLKRIYRRSAEHPKPDRPRWAEANRTTELVRVRLEPDLLEAVEAAAKEAKQTRTDWLKDAIKAHLKPS